MIKGILFDFDGVLIPIDPRIKQEIKQSIIKKYCVSKSVSFKKSRSHVEKAIKNCETDEAYFRLADVAIRIGTHKKGEINALFHNVANKRKKKLNRSVIKMLNDLQKLGIKLGIVSLSSKYRIEQTLKNLQIRNFFSSVESASNKMEEANRSEWKKEAYLNFIRNYEFNSDEVLVVGDSFSIDLKPARELGMQTALIIDKRSRDMRMNENLADYQLSRRILPTKIFEITKGFKS